MEKFEHKEQNPMDLENTNISSFEKKEHDLHVETLIELLKKLPLDKITDLELYLKNQIEEPKKLLKELLVSIKKERKPEKEMEV